MKGKAVIVIGFVTVALVILFISLRGHSGDKKKDAQQGGDKPASGEGKSASPAQAVSIQVVYSTEKKDWLEAVTADFRKQHPAITVELVGKGSLESKDAILEGQMKPAVWSPADSMVLNLLASEWQTKNHADLFAGGDDAPQPLLLTPLVFAVWQDRAEVLLKASGGAISWKAIHKAVTDNRGWAAIGGPGKWGFVKLGHTDPTRSNSGLQALFLMSLEFYGKKTLAVEDLMKPDYQAFVTGIEKGVTKFESSTGTFMTDMIRFGPSKYDVAVVYEAIAISQLANAQGRWGNLNIYYPATTVWSDHPIAVLQGDWVSEPQKLAARAYVDFLRARPQQERALEFGFRPADTSVAVKGAANNPFTRYAEFGITVDVPTAVEAPDGAVVQNLIMMWQRLVRR